MNMKQFWKVLSWHIQYGLNHIDRQHVLAIGLISLWTMTLIAVDYPLYIENQRLDSQLATFKRADGTGAKLASSIDRRQDLLTEFVASLPTFHKYPEQLRSLLKLADENGIILERIEYKYEHMPSLPIQKLVLHVNIIGKEMQQRKFMRMALNAVSNLSIAKLAYSKSNEDAVGSEYKLEINLYYRVEKGST